jgi:hypothetical protein
MLRFGRIPVDNERVAKFAVVACVPLFTYADSKPGKLSNRIHGLHPGNKKAPIGCFKRVIHI